MDETPRRARLDSRPRQALDEYLTLCKHPAANLTAWGEIDRGRVKHGYSYIPEAKARKVFDADRFKPIRDTVLHGVRLRMGAQEPGGGTIASLFARSGTDTLRPHGLQPLRTTGRVTTTTRSGDRGRAGGTSTGGSGRGGRETAGGIARPFKSTGESAKLNRAVIDSAGKLETMRYERMKSAIRADRSKSAAERQAIIARLTQEQSEAVAKARQEALDRERAKIRTARLQRAKGPPKPPGGPEKPRPAL